MKTIYDQHGNPVANLGSLPETAEVSVADYDTLKAQNDPDSHREFMNKQKRGARLAAHIQTMVSEMVAPPKSPEFKTISDNEFLKLMEGGPTLWKEESFTPIQRYPAALSKIRKLYKGEVGYIQKPGQSPFFLVLEESEDRKIVGSGMEVNKEPAPTQDPGLFAFKVFLSRESKYLVVVAESPEDAIDALPMEHQDSSVATRLSSEFVECAENADQTHKLMFVETKLRCSCGRNEE